jgi:cytosine/adenosine deaminase-related metal-dependent hydrolase
MLRIAGSIVLAIALWASQTPTADFVLLDGVILTVDDQFRIARALAVRDGKFLAVGSIDDIRRHIGNTTRVVDGRGRTVVPGFIDTHVHALDVAAAEASQPFQNLQSTIIQAPVGSGRHACTRVACANIASLLARNSTPPHLIAPSSSTLHTRSCSAVPLFAPRELRATRRTRLADR